MKRTTIFALLFASAQIMHAQYLTTWVASNGNDANSCLRDGPCRTFAAAYVKTDTGGIIRAVDTADYGPVTIKKSITIDGGDSGAYILATNTSAISITSGIKDIVTIRNLHIHTYTAGGIYVGLGVSSVTNVENVSISGEALVSERPPTAVLRRLTPN